MLGAKEERIESVDNEAELSAKKQCVPSGQAIPPPAPSPRTLHSHLVDLLRRMPEKLPLPFPEGYEHSLGSPRKRNAAVIANTRIADALYPPHLPHEWKGRKTIAEEKAKKKRKEKKAECPSHARQLKAKQVENKRSLARRGQKPKKRAGQSSQLVESRTALRSLIMALMLFEAGDKCRWGEYKLQDNKYSIDLFRQTYTRILVAAGSQSGDIVFDERNFRIALAQAASSRQFAFRSKPGRKTYYVEQEAFKNVKTHFRSTVIELWLRHSTAEDNCRFGSNYLYQFLSKLSDDSRESVRRELIQNYPYAMMVFAFFYDQNSRINRTSERHQARLLQAQERQKKILLSLSGVEAVFNALHGPEVTQALLTRVKNDFGDHQPQHADDELMDTAPDDDDDDELMDTASDDDDDDELTNIGPDDNERVNASDSRVNGQERLLVLQRGFFKSGVSFVSQRVSPGSQHDRLSLLLSAATALDQCAEGNAAASMVRTGPLNVSPTRGLFT